MMKVVADIDIPYLKELISSDFECLFMNGSKISSSDVKDADVLIVRTRTVCNRMLLEGSSVKFIATATIGTDHIDLDYCVGMGIHVVSAAGCNARSVQCYIASVLSYFNRNRGGNLDKKTLGIIGHGNVGTLVEKVGRAFDMNVIINDPPKEANDKLGIYSSLDDLINKSDFITFHVPLVNSGELKTHHLVNIDFIDKVKNSMILINSSRGEVIDTVAVRSFNPRNLVIDVWENEPNINLYYLQNVSLGTPHIAGYSADGKLRGSLMVARELYKFAGMEKELKAGIKCTIDDTIEINCKGRSANDVISSIVKKVYNVDEDNIRLKYSPTTFEHQRANYKMRRDFDYYKLKLHDANQELIDRLKLLEFKAIEND